MIKINNKIYKYILLILCLLCLFIFQKINYITVKNTVDVFLNSILPSLFPFILFTNIIINSDLITSVTRIFKKYNYIISVIIIGFLCGYPMGAKITYKYYIENKITKKQAYFLMSFANNCNPIFILSTIGICVLNNTSLAIILCISHYVSSLVIGFIYFSHNNIIHEKVEKSNKIQQKGFKILHKSFFDIIDESIKSSFVVLGNIFAFIMIFGLIFSILEIIMLKLNVPKSIIYSISALFEVTNGCKLLYLNTDLNLNLVLSIISFMLGFSGFSIIFQVYSCIYKARIKLIHLIKYKFIQGLLSFFITYIIMNIKNGYNIKSTFQHIYFNNISYFILIVCILFLCSYSIKKVTQK